MWKLPHILFFSFEEQVMAFDTRKMLFPSQIEKRKRWDEERANMFKGKSSRRTFAMVAAMAMGLSAGVAIPAPTKSKRR
jgi:hypothetical protein